MPGCFLVNCGQVTPVSFGPLVSTKNYECLMMHRASGRAVILTPDDIRGEPNVVALIVAATWRGLLRKAESYDPADVPTPQERTAAANWCTANGYSPPTAAQETWKQLILFIARQVNPGAKFRDRLD